jgi:hypothetical protein
LKKELLLRRSLASLSSNWSAPNDDTHGLMPPVPSAIMYSATNTAAVCPPVGSHAPFAAQNGTSPFIEVVIVNSTSP